MKVKVGDKIRIIEMDGEPRYTGKEGIVDSIDDMGQIHGSWGGCALIPDIDRFEIIYATVKKDKNNEYIMEMNLERLKEN